MKRLPLLPGGLYGRVKAAARLGGKITGLAADRGGSVLDAVRAVRAVLPRISRRDRVDKAAEQEVIRLISVARGLARRRVPAAGREKSPGRACRELGFTPPGRPGRSERLTELLGFAPPGSPRSYAQATEPLGFARPDPATGRRYPDPATRQPGAVVRHGSHRERHSGGPEIGR